MFNGINGAGIHVEVIFAFNNADFITAVFQQKADGGGADALAQAAQDAAGNEDVFGFNVFIDHLVLFLI